MKYYENIRVVYEIRSRLKEWADQEEQDRQAQQKESAATPQIKAGEKPAATAVTRPLEPGSGANSNFVGEFVMEQTGNIQVAYCRICGKALAPEEQHPALGTIYCAEHVPPAPFVQPPPAPDSPWTRHPPRLLRRRSTQCRPARPSPGLAFILGLIPGVGAIYNAQYAKGLIHVVIFGLLISIANSDSVGEMQPLFGMLRPAWVFYMAFEAYHTAKKRSRAWPVEEFSSVIPVAPRRPAGRPGRNDRPRRHFPPEQPRPVLRFSQILRFWPVALIGLGIYMLIQRTSTSSPEVGREQ